MKQEVERDDARQFSSVASERQLSGSMIGGEWIQTSSSVAGQRIGVEGKVSRDFADESSGGVLLHVDTILRRDRLEKGEAGHEYVVPCTSAESTWPEILHGDGAVYGCLVHSR